MTATPPTDPLPFAGLDFADNPEPRCPCLLILDSSESMQGAKIDQLNRALLLFRRELLADTLAAKRVELALIRFGPVNVVQEFCSPEQFSPPCLLAGGDTPMGAAVLRALDLLERRRLLYRSHGVSCYRPWLILITDGAPTDRIDAAAAAIAAGEAAERFAFFAIAVDGADCGRLAELSTRAPLRLRELRFRELFLWLSSSMKAVSQSSPHTRQLSLPAPDGWARL